MTFILTASTAGIGQRAVAYSSLFIYSRAFTSPAISNITSTQPALPPRSRPYSSSSQTPIRNRTAIITGSSRGIGLSIANRLASDGYNICIHDIPSLSTDCEAAVSALRTNHLGGDRKFCYALGDVSSRSEVEEIVATSVRELGDLDVMVANAGIAQVLPALEVSEGDMRRMFGVNVFGLVNCYVAAARQMISQQGRDHHQIEQQQQPSGERTGKEKEREKEKGKKKKINGKIIGAASIAAFKPTPLLSHYSASKFAVRGLTQAYAMELAEHGITVNAYAPGIVGTKMWDLIDSEMAKQKGMERGEVLRKMVQDNTALGRVSVPEDVAGLVSFLASEDSDFVTGQTMVVDGGIVYT